MKVRPALFIFGAAFISAGCNSPNEEGLEEHNTFFDIPTFFEQEIITLKKNNPLVLKTVYTDDFSEQKKVHLSDWAIELSPFTNVDLNTPAYQGFIHKDSLAGKVEYTFTNDKLDLKKITILYQEKEPIAFEIEKITKNFLYETTEKLTYKKDIMYDIQKNQKVILMDENKYRITGQMN